MAWRSGISSRGLHMRTWPAKHQELTMTDSLAELTAWSAG